MQSFIFRQNISQYIYRVSAKSVHRFLTTFVSILLLIHTPLQLQLIHIQLQLQLVFQLFKSLKP